MPPLNPRLLLLLLAAAWSAGLLYVAAGEAGGGSCELSVARGGALYNFSLAAPTPVHRHGVLSEDGFYKVAMNDSVIWFQLCDQMIFNFDPPVCLRCEDCGGPLRCGTQCSALVSHNIRGTFILLIGYIFTSFFLAEPLMRIRNNTGGVVRHLSYDVCTTIGRASESHISLIDEGNPQKGVIIKMSSSKCSISVSIFCDSAAAQLPEFSQSGNCDYATILRHPSGCARSVSASGNGWGWLGTSFITMLCLLGGYILVGAIYRYYFLGIHSAEAIPNLEYWISLPQKVKSVFVASTRNPRSRSRDTRGPYAPVNH